jgi:hypothetical protein
MRTAIQRLVGRFSFCVGIGTNQITPEYKTISFWEIKQIHQIDLGNVKLIKPKMFNVKPQPFSVQIKDKRKKK